jgi:hypothetical protein
VEAVNFNDPAQTVIAGSRAAVDKACEWLKSQGAKRALPLPVSAPFHSSLMRPAAERLKQALAATALQAPLIALDRSFGASGLIPSQGLAKTSGTTFPANFNFTKVAGGVGSGNITYPNCAPPLSVSLGTGVCRYDYTAAIDLIPQTDNTNINTKGTFKLGGDQILTLSAVASQNTNVSHVAPDPVTSLTMPNTSPFYPSTYPGINTASAGVICASCAVCGVDRLNGTVVACGAGGTIGLLDATSSSAIRASAASCGCGGGKRTI